MGAQLHRATELVIELGHSAGDCLSIALALDKGCLLAAADERLLQKAGQTSRKDLAATLADLKQAAASV
jgi:predicted nucleic acid-binding protein